MAAGVSYTTAQLLQAQAIVDEMLLRGVGAGGGGGTGGGDASAYNQTLEIARLEAIRDKLPAMLVNGRLVVDASQVTQPVNGTVNVGNFPATQPISTTALPLPDGAATESTLGSIATRVGNLSDVSATNDIGSFSLIALIKRLLTKLPSVLSNDRLKVESVNTSVSRTTTFTNTTTTGTIAAGANSVAIANIGAAVGTVKGVNLPAGASISFAANGNDTLDAIIYSATGTNLLITTVV